MSRLNGRALTILPLLSILSIAPAELEKLPQRGLASENVVQEAQPEQKEDKEELKFPRFDAVAETIELKPDLKRSPTEIKDIFLQFKQIFPFAKKDLQARLEDKDLREGLKEDLRLDVRDLKQIETWITSEPQEGDEQIKEDILKYKKLVEDYLGLVESAENGTAPEAEVAEAQAEEEQKEEVKEENKEEKTAKEEKEQDKKKEEVACEHETEKEKPLTEQVKDLVSQQNLIVQMMQQMAQMMYQMQIQNMYREPYPFPSAYQYIMPPTGNWVYQPDNQVKSTSENIFTSQPAVPHMNYPMMSPYAGGMGSWGLTPQMQFQADPRFEIMPMTPGTFGHDPFSFNMSAAPGIGRSPGFSMIGPH